MEALIEGWETWKKHGSEVISSEIIRLEGQLGEMVSHITDQLLTDNEFRGASIEEVWS